MINAKNYSNSKEFVKAGGTTCIGKAKKTGLGCNCFKNLDHNGYCNNHVGQFYYINKFQTLDQVGRVVGKSLQNTPPSQNHVSATPNVTDTPTTLNTPLQTTEDVVLFCSYIIVVLAETRDDISRLNKLIANLNVLVTSTKIIKYKYE
jgi:hypothetical protein